MEEVAAAKRGATASANPPAVEKLTDSLKKTLLKDHRAEVEPARAAATPPPPAGPPPAELLRAAPAGGGDSTQKFDESEKGPRAI